MKMNQSRGRGRGGVGGANGMMAVALNGFIKTVVVPIVFEFSDRNILNVRYFEWVSFIHSFMRVAVGGKGMVVAVAQQSNGFKSNMRNWFCMCLCVRVSSS